MPSYDAIVNRTGTGGDLPQQLITDVIGDVRTDSTVTKLGTVTQTDTRDSRLPVLATDVDAFWVTGGDAGLKGVSAAQWQSASLYAEELAVVVPVPDNVIADSSFAVWDALRPLIARAFARRLDRAALFGVDKPSTWGPSVLDVATTGGHVVTATEDPAADLLAAAELVANQELTPTAAAVRNGFEFNAAVTRTQAFQANPLTESNPFPLSIAGMSVATGPTTWDRTKAEAIVADWSNVLVGIRQDITFTTHTDGVITDEQGNIVMNLMQQDTTALRAVMRVGYLLRRPVIGQNAPTVPAAIVKPAAPMNAAAPKKR